MATMVSAPDGSAADARQNTPATGSRRTEIPVTSHGGGGRHNSGWVTRYNTTPSIFEGVPRCSSPLNFFLMNARFSPPDGHSFTG